MAVESIGEAWNLSWQIHMRCRRFWMPETWTYATFRFCGGHCLELFAQARQASIDRQRAVAQLFRSSKRFRLPDLYRPRSLPPGAFGKLSPLHRGELFW
jgi:hypothetical protein